MDVDFLKLQVRAIVRNNYKQSRLVECGEDITERKVDSMASDLVRTGKAAISNFDTKSGDFIEFHLMDSGVVIEGEHKDLYRDFTRSK